FMITEDGLFVLSSEVGVVDVEPSEVVQKGRLGPGRMILVDTKQGRVVLDSEIKDTFSRIAPFKNFLQQAVFIDAESTKRITVDDYGSKGKGIPITLEVLDIAEVAVTEQLVMHGYVAEMLDMILGPMARVGQEPLGSMGHDAPLACLSRLPLSSFYYMQQLFAEATNPAIDPLRESIVMSLECPIGPQLLSCDEQCERADFERPHALACGPNPARRVVLDEPILDFSGACALESRLHDICEEAEAAVHDGAGILILCDRRAGPSRVPVDALLAVGAVHHRLIKCRLRSQTAIIAEVGAVSSIHQMCCLLAFGADAIYPYLAYAALTRVRPSSMGVARDSTVVEMSLNKMVKNYRAAAHAGILKVMSKMGISCLSSYKGAQLFQCIGLAPDVRNLCFDACLSSLGGVGFRALQEDALRLHTNAYPSRPLPPLVDAETSRYALPEMGMYHFRSVGNASELHMNAPDVIAKVQESARKDSPIAYKEYEEWENALVDECELRGLLEICYDKCSPIAVESVETETEIVKRFCTGAVSFGAISSPTHEALAMAMNSLGGRSNTGEGGEDEARFGEDNEVRSRIKQVASGRFGVTAAYLADADEIQIKLAQGAKPGEGGELPGYKVVGAIAEIRKSTPGVGLISPPPHHDMYSIEDVAQLISDLKHTNPTARISLKLVSKIGVGIIAAGLVKGGAGHVVISGNSGGTGAAKWTSIKHAGGPWELGLAESHQVLVLNGLRDRVVLQADGQIRTARDVVYAGLLGSDEIAMTTVPMIALGCVMMRKCHLNTCPVGIATQDPELVRKFAGQPEHLVNFLWLMAGEVRQIMARLGMRRFEDLIGRTDLLRMKSVVRENKKTAVIDLSDMLKPTWEAWRRGDSQMGRSSVAEDLDERILARARAMIEGDDSDLALEMKEPILINNSDRTVGARLSYEIAKHRGSAGLLEGSLLVSFFGSAGQSFGSWLMKGVSFSLEGEANDYVGKGLCGGDIDIRPPKPRAPEFLPEDNVIVGNACLYGATGGRLFINGQAGDRFAVRNSGAVAVVEGCGDHGCEYMTRGVVVVLGTTGRNFAAGMSGGLSYVLDLDRNHCNKQTVYLDPLGGDAREDKVALKALLSEHLKRTGSPQAAKLLADWANSIKRFTKVFPHEYKRVLKEAIVEHVKTGSTVAAGILNDFENMRRNARLQDLDMRPASVAFPDKRAGFKLYSRRNPMISRAPKSRVLDWEEIYSKKPHRSRLYDQLLTTQTARCMDCGTPTCHYPNTGGGGCPLGNRIPTFNQLVYEGQWKLALDRLLDTNNFPEFTGTACPAPCEEACVLSITSPPVTIKSVELAIIEHAFQKGWIQPMPPLTRTYKTVAIVGSGPAGLVAAAQLNKAGHSVTVFERADRIGGLLVYGIPNMKLDKIDKVQRRVEILQQEGIEFKTDIEIGVEPHTLSSLRAGYDAVLVATGATQSRDTLTRIPGRQLKGIYQICSEHTYPCDLALLAMGFTGPDQVVDQGALPRKEGCFDAEYGSYIVNSASLSGIGTEAPVFAAGDCRRGASLIVTALAEGRDVAAVIDRQVRIAAGHVLCGGGAESGGLITIISLNRPGGHVARPPLTLSLEEGLGVWTAFERGDKLHVVWTAGEELKSIEMASANLSGDMWVRRRLVSAEWVLLFAMMSIGKWLVNGWDTTQAKLGAKLSSFQSHIMKKFT
ncbi:conserved hypothetical protein, partial [Perkinsus marinus ATCC 50983]